MIAAMLVVLSAGSAMAIPTPEQLEPVDPIEGCTYFDETGHNLCDEFEAFWNAHGGLPVFGFALTEAYDEVNPDTGETYLTQYLERQRFELHPENEGTVYHVLLGRLGAQILEMNGRNWHEFPQADPSEEHYFAETGHAIAPEFYEYWSTHGLEYGDEGVSLRESVLLFGYPISQPEMETNPDGDTVLTQWFERARFEWHEGEDGGFVLLGRLGAELTAGEEPPPPVEEEPEVIAEGLDNPRHLAVDAEGTVWVAEAGAAGADCVTTGEGEEEMQVCYGMTGSVTNATTGETLIELPSVSDPSGAFASGPHGVAVTDSGEVYVVTGENFLPAEMTPEGIPTDAFGALLHVTEEGGYEVVVDLIAYEEENNPAADTETITDGQPEVHSNPYSVIAVGETLYVVDAGGNDILKVEADGTVTTFGVLGPIEVPAFDEEGQPTGETRMAQPVPTDIAQGPDGAFYVTTLGGEVAGHAQVVRFEDLDGDGDALEEGEMTIYADDLSNAVGVDVDAAGNVYVAQLVNDFATANPGDPTTLIGAVVVIAADGTQTQLFEGDLLALGDVAVSADGEVYATTMSVFPGAGQVVYLPQEDAAPAE
jgi:hypothetical protein